MKSRMLLMIIVLLAAAFPAAAQEPETIAELDGIYVTSNETLIPTEAGYELFAPYPCEQVINVLAGGEWLLIDQMSYSLDPEGTMSTVWGAFKRGEQGLFFSGSSSTFCQATLNYTESLPLTISGDVNFEGKANSYPLFCMATSGFYDEETGEDLPGVVVAMAYDLPGDQSVVIAATLPRDPGTYQLWSYDTDTAINIVTGHSIFPLDMFTGMPAEGVTTQTYIGSYDEPFGTIEITSSEPYTGTLDFTGVQGNLQMTIGFACPEVWGDEFDLGL